jgi:hypothetical protein
MKHSQTIGIIVVLLLLFLTTQPLVIIASKNITVTGWHAVGTNFGQPGKFLLIVSIFNIICFTMPNIFAKRINMAFAALSVAWSFRNLLILGGCSMGECPEKQFALYGCVISSVVILAMSFLPKMKIPNK